MSYDSTILAESNLTAYYKLNEASGTTAADSSANAFNGTINGTLTLNQSAIAAGLDPCMLFDGSTGYISLPSGVHVAEPLSIELWIKSNSISSNSDFYSGNISTYEVGWDVTGGNKCYVAGNGGSYDTTNAFATGNTYYVCLTVDTSQNFTVYVGKVGTDSAPSQWGTGNPGGSLSYGSFVNIGARGQAGPALFFKGYISSVAVYSKLLTSTIMNNHYTVGTTTPSTAPTAQTTVTAYGRDGKVQATGRDGKVAARGRDGIVQGKGH